MGGRRPDKRHRQLAGAYSVEHVNFWHTDPRIGIIKPISSYIFFRLCLISVSEKSEQLSTIWCTFSLARFTQIDRRLMKTSLSELCKCGLIGMSEETGITVYGVRKRHPNLQWNERGHNSTYGTDIKNGREEESILAHKSAQNGSLKNPEETRKTYSGLPPID